MLLGMKLSNFKLPLKIFFPKKGLLRGKPSSARTLWVRSADAEPHLRFVSELARLSHPSETFQYEQLD